MIYEIDCLECVGSGITFDSHAGYDGYIKGQGDKYPCPHCKGNGGFNLAVPCPSKHEGDTGYYRPLSCEEVAELLADCPMTIKGGETMMETIAHALFMTAINEGMLTYKGQPVKLMPREG